MQDRVHLCEEGTCGSYAFLTQHLNEVKDKQVLLSEECICGSSESIKRAFITLNEAGNIGRWAVTLSPFVRLRDTQGSMAPCDLIFEHTAFCRRPNMQGG